MGRQFFVSSGELRGLWESTLSLVKSTMNQFWAPGSRLLALGVDSGFLGVEFWHVRVQFLWEPILASGGTF